MDGFLNHEHNDGKSILMTIDSLPGKYSQEKSPDNGRRCYVIAGYPVIRGRYLAG